MSIDVNLWKNYFKDKFELDRMLNAMIWCGNVYITGNNAEIESDRKDMEQLVKAMNNEKYFHADFKDAYYNDGVIFYKDKNDNKVSFLIRGWGYLTSSGIPEDLAVKIQDSLGAYIITYMHKINEKIGDIK